MIQIEKRDLLILKNILNKYPYKFYAYGSRVKGSHKKFSDLDLCITDNISNEILFNIKEAFEESNISIKVDIKRWNIDMDENFRSLIKNDLVLFAVGKPEFTTSHALTKSGREVRHLDRNNICQKYLIKKAKLSSLEFEQFNIFFKARRGSNFAFRFRDYADYKGSGEIIAKGDGNLNKFQLKKIYADPILPYERIITKPIGNSVTLYINNVRTMGVVDYNDGVVTLPNPLANGIILTADFIFDVAVRFSVDSFEYSYSCDGSIELSDIELVEVML